jgi:hypothetical protein
MLNFLSIIIIIGFIKSDINIPIKKGLKKVTNPSIPDIKVLGLSINLKNKTEINAINIEYLIFSLENIISSYNYNRYSLILYF